MSLSKMGSLDEVIVISDDEGPSQPRRSKRLKTGATCMHMCLLSANTEPRLINRATSFKHYILGYLTAWLHLNSSEAVFNCRCIVVKTQSPLALTTAKACKPAVEIFACSCHSQPTVASC